MQLELDSKTPLYDGCYPEVTRLSFMLELLKTKAKNKWTDKILDDHLKYLHNKVLPEGNLCPTSVEEAKKIICPFYLPHIRYQTCINDCIIYQGGTRRNQLSSMQCFSIQEGRKESSSESCMVLSDHSPSAAVFRRS